MSTLKFTLNKVQLRLKQSAEQEISFCGAGIQNVLCRGLSNSTAGRAFSLHAANPSSIPSIP